jgi:hypothetical protein
MSKQTNLLAKRVPWRSSRVVTPIKPGLVIRSSQSSLVVLWGTMVEMVELHVVG